MAYSAPAPDADQGEGGASTGNKTEFLKQARARFNQVIEATTANRNYQVDDLKFAAGSPDNGYQWPDAVKRSRLGDPNGPRPVLTINKLPQHINQVTGEQRQNRPSIKVLPVDDKSDVEVAEVLNGIVRHIENASDADVAYDTACENQVTHGEGFFRVLTDYCDEMSFLQDILIEPIKNSFSVYMDPNGLQRDPTGRKCEWCFITEDLTREDFKAQFPDKQPVSWDELARGDEMKNWILADNMVRIAEYFCFKDEKKTLCLFSDGSVTVKGGDEALTPLQMVEKPVKERVTTIRRVMWAKVSGFEVLEEQDWAGKFIPVVRVAGNEFYIEGKMVVSGIVRNAKDAQRMYNYWASQETEMLALAPKAPFVGAAGQFENFESKWKTANTVNYAYLEYNSVEINGTLAPPPQRQMPPLPPAGIVNAKLGAADDIKSATGQYDPSLGNNPQAKSGVALKQEQRKSDVGTFHYIDNLSRAIRHCGRILIDLIPKIYDTRRVTRIIGEDGTPDHAVLDPESPMPVQEQQDEEGAVQKIYNPSMGRYDVTVTVGPSYATRRQESAEGMVQLVQANPELWKVIGDLLVRNMDWPGAEEMADRIKKAMPPEITQDEEEGEEPVIQTPKGPLPVSQAPQAIAQMMQENMLLTEQLEKAGVLDKENAARKLEIDYMNAETNRLSAASSAELNEAKVKQMIFEAVRDYVDRTPEEDSGLLSPMAPKEPTAETETV